MKAFEQNIIHLYGEKGKQWLDDLPGLLMQNDATGLALPCGNDGCSETSYN